MTDVDRKFLPTFVNFLFQKEKKEKNAKIETHVTGKV